MRTITVSTGKNAPNGFGVQKYDNDETWNVVNGSAPNGVNATRWLRKTTPDPQKLTPLAAWLVEHVPSYCAGKMPAFNHTERVRCYNGKTEGDMMRSSWRQFLNGTNTEADAKQIAENFCKCYNLDDRPARIDDFLFDQIRFEESDENYWNRQAASIIAAGTVRVEIGQSTYCVTEI